MLEIQQNPLQKHANPFLLILDSSAECMPSDHAQSDSQQDLKPLSLSTDDIDERMLRIKRRSITFDNLNQTNTFNSQDPSFLVVSPKKSHNENFTTPRTYRELLNEIDLNMVVLRHVKFHYSHVIGSILVKNICFSKHVSIRYTLDDWKTYRDDPAVYKPTRPSDIDIFSFDLDLSSDDIFNHQVTLQFAVHYKISPDAKQIAEGVKSDYWDNNHDKNYKICFQIELPKISSLSHDYVLESDGSSSYEDTFTKELSRSHSPRREEVSPVLYPRSPVKRIKSILKNKNCLDLRRVKSFHAGDIQGAAKPASEIESICYDLITPSPSSVRKATAASPAKRSSTWPGFAQGLSKIYPQSQDSARSKEESDVKFLSSGLHELSPANSMLDSMSSFY
eukprot:TRINITY_DN9312_c0_g1_i1.p2 TRINITY_DN9312_c0_g1~~TRINITY_DN9312_c0_g1_i1.p2  ORF type:complete len:447 (+),score=158.23 TRINITY_DN9312_c0_g1_i1:166-1341(+)